MARGGLVLNLGSYRFMLIFVINVADANLNVMGGWVCYFLKTQNAFLTP